MTDPRVPPESSKQPASVIVARPSIETGSAYKAVSKAYFDAVHSVLAGQDSAPEAAAELEKQLIEITGFRPGPPKTTEGRSAWRHKAVEMAERDRMKSADGNYFNMGRRLALIMALLVALILGGNGLVIYQFKRAQLQTDRLTGVSQQLIAVLRLQESLLSFHQRLNRTRTVQRCASPGNRSRAATCGSPGTNTANKEHSRLPAA